MFSVYNSAILHISRSGALSEVEVICFRDRTKDGKREVNHSIVFTVGINSIANVKGKCY